MDLYASLPAAKDGSDVSAKATAAKRALMAPTLLRQRLTKAASTKERPAVTSAVYAGATGLRAMHAAPPPHLSRDTVVCDGRESEEEDEDAAMQGFDDSHRFVECTNEYDPMLPNSMESVVRAREAARAARLRQLELEREQEQLEEERNRNLISGVSSSVSAGRGGGAGRGINNLPAWMRAQSGEAARGQIPIQDGSAFVGGGDNAGLGLSSSTEGLGASEVSSSVPAPAIVPRDPISAAATSDVDPIAPNSKAMKMMAAWGYKRGGGLGKDGTGITSALEHVKTGSRSGVIVSRGTAQPSAVATASVAGSSSRVIMLCNIAAPGDVDDDLAEEVQDECTKKYGAVQQCFVYECAAVLGLPPEEAVRTFVMFGDATAAESARASLDGRFFGGRKIRASFYDESKFLRLDLAPDGTS